VSTATERVDPRCCQVCRTTEVLCDSKRLLRGDRYCPAHQHDAEAD
jgi:hypothetical protein